jgi:thimet oligopeptidase
MKHIQYTKRDFAWTKWTPSDIDVAADRVTTSKKVAYATVKKVPAARRTFANTVAAIEVSDRCLGDLFKISLLMNVSPKREVREAARRAMERIEKKLVDFEYDEEVYRALREYAANLPAGGENLRGADKKLFDDMLRDFRRRGFDLSRAKREELKKHLKELSKLKHAFEKNLNDYKDALEIPKEECAGLPENYVNGLPRKGGKYVVSLDYPSYIPFMENAESEERRRELSEKNWRKGGEKNVLLLEKMVRLREENAKLLNYATHADFVTEERMAGDADAVFSFLQGIMTPLAKQVKEDVKDLFALKDTGKGPSSLRGRSLKGTLEVYDVAYLANKLKKLRYTVDSEAIREYFPLPHVREEMFALFGKLLGVSYERVPWPLWHKDAELYAIRDGKSRERIAYFAFDLFPREGKYGHACVSNVISGHETEKGFVPPFATLITNFPKPSRNHPSLLSHDEVVTLFHEFGHLMHESLSEAKYVSQSGFSVAWDFVEAMSQMFEFFVWEERVLRKLSRHYVTGKPLPLALLRKLIASKRHLLAYDTLRQAVSALYDMMMHTGNLRGTLPGYFRKLSEAHLGVKIPETSLFPAGFGHMAGGYDAGYYGYLWSLVYAADFFTKFREAGVISPKVGKRYRQEILAKGSSEAEGALAEAFLGRKLSNAAFLEDIGIRGSR